MYVFRTSEFNLIVFDGVQTYVAQLHYRPQGDCEAEWTCWPM
jgi:hypothetical protein